MQECNSTHVEPIPMTNWRKWYTTTTRITTLPVYSTASVALPGPGPSQGSALPRAPAPFLASWRRRRYCKRVQPHVGLLIITTCVVYNTANHKGLNLLLSQMPPWYMLRACRSGGISPDTGVHVR